MENPSLAAMQASFEQAATELETAARHCRIAAAHFAASEVPRGCAHGFAALGHVSNAQSELGAATRLHATKAQS